MTWPEAFLKSIEALCFTAAAIFFIRYFFGD